MGDSTSRILFALLVGTSAACGPADVPVDCVPIDEQLGDTVDRQWCDGELYPSIEWNGEIADSTRMVCFLPEEDGECERCSTEEIRQAVDQQLQKDLAEYKPECALEHWELGCMRTIENAKKFGREPESCCFQVAVWGEMCGMTGAD